MRKSIYPPWLYLSKKHKEKGCQQRQESKEWEGGCIMVGMGLKPGLVPAQYSAWVLTGTREDRQEAVAHRITLLYGSFVGDISLSWTRYLGPACVAFSLFYIIYHSSCICIKVHNVFYAPPLHLSKTWTGYDLTHTRLPHIQMETSLQQLLNDRYKMSAWCAHRIQARLRASLLPTAPMVDIVNQSWWEGG